MSTNRTRRESPLADLSKEEVLSLLKDLVLLYRDNTKSGAEIAEQLNADYGVSLEVGDVLAYASKLRTTGVSLPKLNRRHKWSAIHDAAKLLREMDERGELKK